MKVAPVSGELGGHMYLVKRSVFVENGIVLSNDYDAANDRVIRGAANPTSLGATEGPLGLSLDRCGPEETPETRHSVDVTQYLGGVERWSELTSWAEALDGKYWYEVPVIFDHTVNSNAVILTLFAKAGFDIRDVPGGEFGYVNSFFDLGAPGANGDTATLLAVDVA